MISTTNKYIFFGLLLLLFSCDKRIEKPENLIAQEKMVLVLADKHQLEALFLATDDGNDDYEIFRSRYMPMLFEEHSIAADEFTSSFDWYIETEEEGLKLLKLVKEELDQRKEKQYLYKPKLLK